MKLLRPVDLSQTMLISSNVVEVCGAWSSTTAYAVDTQVVLASTQRVYQCIQGPSTNNSPDTSILFWVDVGPSNRWAMFDDQMSTASSAYQTLSVTIATGMINSVAMIAVDAYDVQLTLRDGLNGPILYDNTLNFSVDAPTDWAQYFFYDPDSVTTQQIIQNLPEYSSTHMTVTLRSAQTVKIGGLMFGRVVNLGTTGYGATAGIIDYSRKTTDAFGVTTFVKREFSKRLTVNMTIQNTELNRVQRALYGARAKPCVWVGSDVEDISEALVVFGFYRDFTTTVSYAVESYCSLEIEGLT